MASTSRQSSLFGLADWKKLYQAYSSADLQSYDYESLRQNFISYLTRNYPETYNDYVESSEYVALLDVMAYMGQALAFRSDLNSRENFLDTAQRRDSVIKLANLVGYNPKRNIAGQGMVKVTALSTTEALRDINGNSLGNQVILWNDPANSAWQEQFNTIINAALLSNQRIGKPGNSQNLLDIKTDEYTINIPSNQLPTASYQASINGKAMNFELVSVTSLGQSYLYELPPKPNNQFNMLYRNDKLGYGSQNTGFFFYFKQGTLQTADFSFKEKIQNNLQQVNIQGINNEDTWLYKLDSTGNISDLWTQVENVYASTTSSSTKPRSIYSVASRSNDEITYVFADGVFGEIPVGSFRAFVRSSNALQYTIDPAEMSGLSVDINYISRSGRTETLTVAFSLQTPCSTSQSRESLLSIKERAPARFYSQNRMVNGEDYTNFPFTLYNSIIKSKAINRSSIGVSRNLDLLDPTAKYSSTNVFADDGALTFKSSPYTTKFSTSSSNYATEFLTSILPTILNYAESVQYYQTYYSKVAGTIGGTAYTPVNWNLSTITGTQVTGYFYTGTSTSKTIQPLGTFSSDNLKYITKGALLKFVSTDTAKPYFDTNNRLTSEVTGVTSIWVGVDYVNGDGYNYGTGNLSDGSGPVTLSAYVPLNVKLAAVDSIIPSFDNTLSSTIATKALSYIRLQQDFALQFNNLLGVNSERWSVIDIPTTTATNDYLVKFEHNLTSTEYTVSIRQVTYSFASVNGVRFVYDTSKRVYDPKTGEVLSDYVNLLPMIITNGSNVSVSGDYVLNITGQDTQKDGYKNDFEVNVSPINVSTGYSSNPDFFKEVVGGGTEPAITPATAVFFNRVTETKTGIETTTLMTSGSVIYDNTNLSTLDKINDVVQAYPTDTLFYCENALSVNLSITPPVESGNTVHTVSVISSVPHRMSTGTANAVISNSALDVLNGEFTVSLAGNSVSDYTKKFSYTTSSSTLLSSQINLTGNTTSVTATVANSAVYQHGLTVDATGQQVVIANVAYSVSVPNASAFTFAANLSNITQTSNVTFYHPATVTNRFYQSSLDTNSATVSMKLSDVTKDYSVKPGKGALKFQYRHNSGQTNRIDPATSNIIDLYLVTQSYYTQYMNWLSDTTDKVAKPDQPTLNELQQAYAELESYKMMSDSIILNSVTFKPLFGKNAELKLQGTIKVVKNPNSTASDSQIRSSVLSALNTYFSIDNWGFGDQFFFSELTAYLHSQLGSLISSVILVPGDPTQQFGDMYQVRCEPHEIFVNGATASDIAVITSLTSTNMGR